MKHREPIFGLDLIRFLAAMSVLGWHVAYRFFDSHAAHIRVFVGGVPIGRGPFHSFTQWGWIGVQIFFVISGLVISYSAEGTSPRRFLLGRFARLVPGVLVCALLIFCIDLFFWHRSLTLLVMPMVKTLIFWPLGGWITPQFWTLPVEVAFYAIVWGFIAAKSVDRLDQLAMALVAISALHLAVIHWGLSGIRGDIADVLLLKHGMYFAIGICLCSLDKKGYSLMRLLVIAAAIALATFEISRSIKSYGIYSAAEPDQWMTPFVIWLSMVAMITLSLGWKNEIARVVRAARLAGLLRTIGLSTYPLYLTHIHVAGLAITLAISFGMAVMPALALGATVCVLVSALIAVLIEPQVRRLLLAPFGGASPSKAATEVRPSLPGLGGFSTEQV